ncbi:hypothetical protein I302_103169 [Kwoniella bestiolae CBS 10118]|uniref:Uncharacterized protein n=1 Tax=Kwoniella bestiolae CBS 10118 TaxID=1296100 RepID=A0A1B9G7P2_9TREE|nr:hypothetical protein I302_01867 [Kwoniella bestiolae CBS 10118]OCF27032.1 hypothetical protein I302_01867 [Kwoniella bestiolae CBS 10118]
MPPQMGEPQWYGSNDAYNPSQYYSNQPPPPPTWNPYQSYPQSWYPHPAYCDQCPASPSWAGYGCEYQYGYPRPPEDDFDWYSHEEQSPDIHSDRSTSPANDRSTSPVKDPTAQRVTPTLTKNTTWYPESPWVGSSTVQGSIQEYCKNAYDSILSKRTAATEERVKRETEMDSINEGNRRTYDNLSATFRRLGSKFSTGTIRQYDVDDFEEQLNNLDRGLQTSVRAAKEMNKAFKEEMDCSEKLTNLNELMGRWRDSDTKGCDVQTAREMLATYGPQFRNDASSNPIKSHAEVFINSHYGNAPNEAQIPFWSTEATNDPRDTAIPQNTPKGSTNADIFAEMDSANAFTNWPNNSYDNPFAHNPYASTFNSNPFAYNTQYQNVNTAFTGADYWGNPYNGSPNAHLGTPYGTGVSYGPSLWVNLRDGS